MITYIMGYRVTLSNKGKKSFRRCPEAVKSIFYNLKCDLEKNGPLQPEWPNYSKLGKVTYHCHLNRNWIAVWVYNRNINSLKIEVNYVGSRESAPY